MGQKIAVLIRDAERQHEGLRTSLGLLLEQHEVLLFVLSHELDLPEESLDNMGFLDEMGGRRLSDVPENVRRYGFEPVTLAEVGTLLREAETVIPF